MPRFLHDRALELLAVERHPPSVALDSSRNWMRSKIVKRAPQAVHWCRRWIALPSSTGRESLTWLSSDPQNGQYMGVLLLIAEPNFSLSCSVQSMCQRHLAVDKPRGNRSPSARRNVKRCTTHKPTFGHYFICG
jgi:hypothetical protein